MSALALYQPEPTISMDFEVRFHPDLTWGEKVFLAEIQSMCSRGRCLYFQSKLAEMFGVSSVCIHTWIKKLCILGYIEIGTCEDDPGCKLYIKLKDKKIT